MLLVCFANSIRAGYRAGEISYRWIQGYTYEIKYTTFTDDIPLPDNKCRVDSVCFGDGARASLTRINGNCNGSCSPYCDGVVILPGVRMNEYKTTHTYPGPGNYQICFIYGDRSAGISNISNSVNGHIEMEAYLVISTFTGSNSSPAFLNYPIAEGCINNGCYTYNAGATDADGDSLSYSLVSYSQAPGFSLPAASSPGTFSLNPVTGILSWCNPSYSGDFNVYIKTEEWRTGNGAPRLVGYVQRDTHFRMSVCTGITETKQALSADVFPNPASEMVTLILSGLNIKYSIEVKDITGRKVKTFVNEEPYKEALQLSLEGLDPGAYLISITGNHQTITKKIIKQ